jgi:hypothetical protein
MQTITAPKPFCFVLMPFAAEFADIYEFGIKGACSDVDVYCERVDEQVFFGSMLDRIYNQISRADLIVADMTGKNQNVFYEVGYAHALGKTVILLTQNAEDIPFDLKHFPHIVYQKQISNLRAELSRRVKHIASSKEPAARHEIGLELFCGSQALALGTALFTYPADEYPGATITIFNGSATTFGPGDFRLAAIAPANFSHQIQGVASVTEMPDGRQLHMLPEFETLFPGAHTSAKFWLGFKDRKGEFENINIDVRVFAAAGYRDFALALRVADA